MEIHTKKINLKNHENIKKDLYQNWDLLLPNSNDVDTNFLLFHNNLTNILDAYTEERNLRVSCKKINKEPWMTKGIITSNNKQLRLYKTWLENKNAISYDRYKQYRDQLRRIKKPTKLNTILHSAKGLNRIVKNFEKTMTKRIH